MSTHTDHLAPSASGYRRGCRCDDCRRLFVRWSKHYRLRTGAGSDGIPRHPVTIPIDRVVQHLNDLVDSGWTITQIAAECGIDRNRLYAMRGGRYGAKRIWQTTATRILTIDPLEPVDLDEVVVERLLAGADWRQIGATRAERIAAAMKVSGQDAVRRFGLRPGRDFPSVTQREGAVA